MDASPFGISSAWNDQFLYHLVEWMRYFLYPASGSAEEHRLLDSTCPRRISASILNCAYFWSDLKELVLDAAVGFEPRH